MTKIKSTFLLVISLLLSCSTAPAKRNEFSMQPRTKTTECLGRFLIEVAPNSIFRSISAVSAFKVKTAVLDSKEAFNVITKKRNRVAVVFAQARRKHARHKSLSRG